MKVAVIMGSDSDMPVVKKGLDIFDSFGVEYDVFIYSAHRTPEKVAELSRNARDNGYGVIIAAAGLAAHLAGAVAANTTLPVIGIPIKGGAFNGLDSLLSTVQMPTGIPVATVAVDGAANAAILAIEILALSNSDLTNKLSEKRIADSEKVLEKNKNL